MYLFPYELRARRVRFWACAAAVVLGVAVLVVLDQWLWSWLHVKDAEALKTKDWWQALRVAGYLPLWVVAGAVWVARDRAARFAGGGVAAWHRGVMLVLAAAGSGLAAELAKLVVRRHRPGLDGALRFDWAGHGVPGLGLGTVSSHAAVAFGAAILAGVFVPAWRWPLALVAAGCALSRVLAGAHFVSDCVLAAVVSYGVVRVLLRVSAEFPGAAEARRR